MAPWFSMKRPVRLSRRVVVSVSVSGVVWPVKREYDDVLSECAQSLDARSVPPEAAIDRASDQLAKVRKRAKRAVDQHTTRRFLPVNTRAGLLRKLDELHEGAVTRLEELKGTVGSHRSPDSE
ncbi:hypothetical protein [Nonomuraea sp. NPDC050643]|uniref:hypothetical protein n=1 Tax=Nonomuraea sp. NPDC050643 TaxID=3155660 RepID=UPI0033E6F526